MDGVAIMKSKEKSISANFSSDLILGICAGYILRELTGVSTTDIISSVLNEEETIEKLKVARKKKK